MAFAEDAHNLRMAIRAQIREFQQSYPTYQVKSVDVAYPANGSGATVDIDIRIAEKPQTYRTKGEVTTPLGTRNGK